MADVISKNKGLKKISLWNEDDEEPGDVPHVDCKWMTDWETRERLRAHWTEEIEPRRKSPAVNNNDATMTPELVRRFIHLPHVEYLTFDFVLSLNPANADDQPIDNDHLAEQVIRLMNRFQDLSEARFAHVVDSTRRAFSYSITISIDRKTFKGLPP
ncbi:hypothetical protein Fcan01_14049 [Folsomia candida]|uniref:Uncharacterized protein n=1 Tax=Folsomia candida TaxID=158441 RepID=A0A226E0W9_FOLCA|nr:hypothetical protein Fcan01_14049 [Folsomia candida]